MKFKFEKLHVWKLSMDLGEDINNLIKSFPKEEKYNLNSQLLRATDSVALNISEGSIGQSNRELNRFIGYSIRSLAEVVTCLYKAKHRSYIDEQIFRSYYEKCYELMNNLIAFKKSVK